ncbi:MAG TPA: OB-fold domain-containing protein [Myxococcota bacterium]|nr:OB-fold domain-containing protein [Myxococcota bacterium]
MSRYLGDDFILPGLTPNNTPFFTAGSIQIQFCDDCGHAQHPPDDLCYACQGRNLSFRTCPGTGRVESCARVHHPLHPALRERVPYVIAIVSVDGAPGVNVQGNVVHCDANSVRIGQKVRAVYEEAVDPHSGTKLLIPQWEPVD